MTVLTVERAGPAMTVQDLGRTGTLAMGLSRGGAADRIALFEAAALLGQPYPMAAIEMPAMGGVFTVDAPTRFALTGAVMRASLNGVALRWNASHVVAPGDRIEIGPAIKGVYGYLSFAGGIVTNKVLGSRSTHLAAGIGDTLETGEHLALGDDPDVSATPMGLEQDDRFSGGIVRILAGPQTSLYGHGTLQRFTATPFVRGTQGNRQGVRLDQDGEGFTVAGQLGIVSDVIIPGDIQMTGDGVPFVLMPECQTIGGYPRIGAVIPQDLPRVAQAAPGVELRFEFITLEEADLLETETAVLRSLRNKGCPLIRDPNDITDLLSYQLISGVTAGKDEDNCEGEL